jgi:hypothetical protein
MLDAGCRPLFVFPLAFINPGGKSGILESIQLQGGGSTQEELGPCQGTNHIERVSYLPRAGFES